MKREMGNLNGYPKSGFHGENLRMIIYLKANIASFNYLNITATLTVNCKI